MARPRIMVIIGTTGVGKTKLGVDLARRMNGEVVNVDVMQMYKGLNIATAKVTAHEMQGVPHHLMSFLDPTTKFSPHEFRARANETIQDIIARKKLPILVGGTMYYVQSLLWDALIPTGKEQANASHVEAMYLRYRSRSGRLPTATRSAHPACRPQ